MNCLQYQDLEISQGYFNLDCKYSYPKFNSKLEQPLKVNQTGKRDVDINPFAVSGPSLFTNKIMIKLQTNGLEIEDNGCTKYKNQLPKPEQKIKTFL